jgi:hypothetical protein
MTLSRPPLDPEDEAEPPEPPRVRRLRLMVSALTLASILGVLVVAGTLAWRLGSGGAAPAAPLRAEAVALPTGERILAVGRSAGALTLATRDEGGVERLRQFDPETGEPRGVTLVRREPPAPDG